LFQSQDYETEIFEGRTLLYDPPESVLRVKDGVVARLPIRQNRPYAPTVEYLPITDRNLSQHVNFIGATGMGKTSAMCHLFEGVRSSMTDNDVLIAFDPKGDYRREFFRAGQDLALSARSGPGDHWSLLAELRSPAVEPTSPSPVEELILNDIGHSLFDDLMQRSSQPFFPMAAKDLFVGITFLLAQEPGYSNLELRRFWTSASLADIRAVLGKHPRTQALVSYIPQGADSQSFGVVAQTQSVVLDVLQEGFAEAGQISIRTEVRKKGKRCIFLEYPISSSASLAPGFKVLVDLCIREALAIGEDAVSAQGQAQGRVFFFIDEFGRLPRMRHLEPAITFGRALGLRFILGMQNHQQIAAAYGPEAPSILGGLNTVIAFRVPDPETRELIKGFGGRNRKKFTLRTAGIGNPVEPVVEGYAVEDSAILALRPGEAVVFMCPSPGSAGAVPEAPAPFKVYFPLYSGKSDRDTVHHSL